MLIRRLSGACLAALLSLDTLGAANADPRLMDAVKNQNIEAVRALVKQRAAINAAEADGMTALHYAVLANDLSTSRLLIGAGANVKASNRYGVTPLGLAATNGSAPMAEALLKAGADPNATLPEGETVLMTAARTGNAETIRLLLAHGANVNAKETWMGETALMWAAAENHPAAVTALVAGGADLNARSTLAKFPQFKWTTSGMVTTSLPRGNWTPLMYAAREGAIDAARALADAKADLNQVDPDGTTAQVLAIINAHYDLAAMLAEKGADPNVADVTGMTALYTATDMHTLEVMTSRPSPKAKGMLTAADVVKTLLDHGANPNPRLKRPLLQRHHDAGDASMGDGTTPFMRASKNSDIEVMRLLVAKGADAKLRQKDHTTALMLASGMGRRSQLAGTNTIPESSTIAAVTLCLDQGVDVNAFNDRGDTALHAAVTRGSISVVTLLIERGARLDTKDRIGRTPLDIAMGVGGQRGRGANAGQNPGNPAIAALLRELAPKTGGAPQR